MTTDPSEQRLHQHEGWKGGKLIGEEEGEKGQSERERERERERDRDRERQREFHLNNFTEE